MPPWEAVLGYWRKHKYKDLERILEVFHRHGWRIDDPPTYYTLRCPCGNHQRWFHCTPSDPNYGKNALKWGMRQPCWRAREEAT